MPFVSAQEHKSEVVSQFSNILAQRTFTHAKLKYLSRKFKSGAFKNNSFKMLLTTLYKTSDLIKLSVSQNCLEKLEI